MEQMIQMIEKYNIPIVQINPDKGYWLIRTQSGQFFEEFHLGNFIAVGWNNFNNPADFTEKNKENTTKAISEVIKDTQAWRVFSQLKRFFHDIKIGDIVMIPSVNSKYIIFGEVISDVYFESISDEDLEEDDICPYQKRRKVKWLKTVERSSLDPYLYKMMQSHFSISNAKDYADAIDRTLHSFYYKGDEAHLILGVKQTNDIPLIDLLDALQAPLELVDVINDLEQENTKFDRRDLDAKLRVQSPGIIEFISSGHAFSLVTILGVLLVGIVGGNFSFKSKKNDGSEQEASIESEGLIEKLMKWRNQTHSHEMTKKTLEVDEPTFRRIMEVQEKASRSAETLKMELPKELINQNEEIAIDAQNQQSEKK